MNLLIAQIAQIAKTFDDVYEASGLNSLFLFSQTVSTWNDAPPFPPPWAACVESCKGERKGSERVSKREGYDKGGHRDDEQAYGEWQPSEE
eukprot:156732-Prymnesium_polylepis.2